MWYNRCGDKMENIKIYQNGMNYQVSILYEDNHIIVCNKPAGILSQGDSTGDANMVDILKEYLKNKYQKPGNVYLGLVHRLDRMTEGVMVFGKTSKASSRLSIIFSQKNDEIIKKYLVIVKGLFPNDCDKKLSHYIKKDEKLVKSFVTTDKSGKLAELEFDVIDHNNKNSLVEVNLLTGRHHQIRVQFSHIGHPVMCDSLYGDLTKGNLCLCAYYLSFIHPVNKKRYEFKVKPVNDNFKLFSLQKIDFSSIIYND